MKKLNIYIYIRDRRGAGEAKLISINSSKQEKLGGPCRLSGVRYFYTQKQKISLKYCFDP